MERQGPRRGATLAAVGLAGLLIGGPAAAHPFVRGGEAPVDSLATLTLAMAHGCGTEQAGGGDPTVEVALEVPDSIRVVEVPQPDGWQVELDRDGDARITTVTWLATTATEPAPDFDLDVVLTGVPGDEVYLRVFQGCEDFAYRWIGTPDEPASDPAVRIVLVEADPSAPPPPEPAAPAEPDPDVAQAETPEDPTDDPLEATDAETGPGPDEDGAADTDAGPAGGDSSPLLVGAVAAAVVAGAVGGWRWIRGRRP
jgi:YD repeat-containing protein